MTILYKTTILGNNVKTVGLEASESKNSYLITDPDHLKKRVKKEELLVPNANSTRDRSIICIVYHSKEDSEMAVELAKAEVVRKLNKNVESARNYLKMAEEMRDSFCPE